MKGTAAAAKCEAALVPAGAADPEPPGAPSHQFAGHRYFALVMQNCTGPTTRNTFLGPRFSKSIRAGCGAVSAGVRWCIPTLYSAWCSMAVLGLIHRHACRRLPGFSGRALIALAVPMTLQPCWRASTALTTWERWRRRSLTCRFSCMVPFPAVMMLQKLYALHREFSRHQQEGPCCSQNISAAPHRRS